MSSISVHTLLVVWLKKNEDINQSNAATHEALTRDVINSFLPLRRRKRIKRKASNSTRTKWPRQDITENTENRPVDQPSVTVNEHGEVVTLPSVHRKSDQNNSTANESSKR